jgi:hypothetical protein
MGGTILIRHIDAQGYLDSGLIGNRIAIVGMGTIVGS